MTSSHSQPDIIAQLERLNLKTDSNTKVISELAEIVRYQVIQSERDRLHFQNSINEINQRQQAQLEAITIGFREITQRAEIDRNTFLDSISENSEDIEQLRERFDQFIEQAAADRQQAAIDRQQFQEEIRRIWEYLYLSQGRNGNSPQ